MTMQHITVRDCALVGVVLALCAVLGVTGRTLLAAGATQAIDHLIAPLLIAAATLSAISPIPTGMFLVLPPLGVTLGVPCVVACTLLGWSFGSMIVFLFARRLRNLGIALPGVFARGIAAHQEYIDMLQHKKFGTVRTYGWAVLLRMAIVPDVLISLLLPFLFPSMDVVRVLLTTLVATAPFAVLFALGISTWWMFFVGVLLFLYPLAFIRSLAVKHRNHVR